MTPVPPASFYLGNMTAGTHWIISIILCLLKQAKAVFKGILHDPQQQFPTAREAMGSEGGCGDDGLIVHGSSV